jgi:hypothetical protein
MIIKKKANLLDISFKLNEIKFLGSGHELINPLKAELNQICHLLAS